MFHFQDNNRAKKGSALAKSVTGSKMWGHTDAFGIAINGGHLTKFRPHCSISNDSKFQKNRALRVVKFKYWKIHSFRARETSPFCTHTGGGELEECQEAKHHEIILLLMQTSTSKQTH